MTNTLWAPVDPTDRFAAAMQSIRGGTETGDPLGRAALKQVIAGARLHTQSDSSVVQAVSDHIVRNSTMTAEVANPVVSAAFAAAPQSDDAKASATSAAVAAAAAPTLTGTVSLADPVMLGPLPRVIAGVLLGAIAVLGTVLAFQLPTGSAWEAYLSTILAIVLGILGLVVVVMGYRTVSITGSTGK